jgi:aquaporin Z
MVVTEVVMTALLSFVVLSTVHRRFAPAASGLAVGLALTLIHLISIPVDNTSVNPARSLGVAVFAGGDALEQLWAFFVFPLVGAALGALAWFAVDDTRTLGAGAAAEETAPAGPGAEPVGPAAAGPA